jgi:long-chain fatty acid transport protein
MRWLVACSSALTLLFCASLTARADPFHHQPVPLGERALGMGGAFAGVANDPSSTYYNPAGLARLEDVAISASLTLIALDRQLVLNGFRSARGSADLEHTSRPSLPVFAGVVKQLGWREGRTRRHAVAFSTFTVDRRRLEFDERIQGGADGEALVDTLTVSDERSARWQGVSYAYRASRELSLGLSAFLAINRMSHSEEQLALLLRAYDEAAGLYRDSDVVVRSRRTGSSVKNGVFRVGALYAFSARLRLGAMFQPPSFRFRGRGSVRDREVITQASPDAQEVSYYDESQSDLAADDPVPWELRVGVSWAPRYALLLSFDASAYGRRGTKEDPIVAIGEPEAAAGTDRAPSPGAFVVERWWSRYSGNLAAGVEYSIKQVALLRGGVYTDLSAAPSVPKRATQYRPADVNRVGATLSIGLLARGYDLSVGAASSFGWGKTLALVADDPDQPYVRTRVREQMIFLFLSGARRAIGKLAEETYEKVRERMGERESTP